MEAAASETAVDKLYVIKGIYAAIDNQKVLHGLTQAIGVQIVASSIEGEFDRGGRTTIVLTFSY